MATLLFYSILIYFLAIYYLYRREKRNTPKIHILKGIRVMEFITQDVINDTIDLLLEVKDTLPADDASLEDQKEFASTLKSNIDYFMKMITMEQNRIDEEVLAKAKKNVRFIKPEIHEDGSMIIEETDKFVAVRINKLKYTKYSNNIIYVIHVDGLHDYSLDKVSLLTEDYKHVLAFSKVIKKVEFCDDEIRIYCHRLMWDGMELAFYKKKKN